LNYPQTGFLDIFRLDPLRFRKLDERADFCFVRGEKFSIQLSRIKNFKNILNDLLASRGSLQLVGHKRRWCGWRWKNCISERFLCSLLDHFPLGQCFTPGAFGGFTLGSLGPVSEGLFIWIFGIGALVAITVWITAKSN